MTTGLSAGQVRGLGVSGAVMLIPSAFLASASGSIYLVFQILSNRMADYQYPSFKLVLDAWCQNIGETCLPQLISHEIMQHPLHKVLIRLIAGRSS